MLQKPYSNPNILLHSTILESSWDIRSAFYDISGYSEIFLGCFVLSGFENIECGIH